MTGKPKTLITAIYGEIIKICCRLNLIGPLYHIPQDSEKRQRVIVSVTSYGRRVKSVLSYSLISLFRQTHKPDMIVLWLDADKWEDKNLPKQLMRLKKYGLTIRYCQDLKSYTKIIPSLRAFPDDLIITFDDDCYYRNNAVERLVAAYNNDPSRIYALRAHRIKINSDGMLLPYKKWEKEIYDDNDRFVFPTGVGGVLYDLKLLHDDVCKEELFLSLAPKADDVWLYFMEYLKGTRCRVLPNEGISRIPLNVFYRQLHKKECLAYSNISKGGNDCQIKAVMNHYCIDRIRNDRDNEP